MRPDADKLNLRWKADSRRFMGHGRVFWATVADGVLMAIVAQEEGKWHLSISHRLSIVGPGNLPIPGRYPTWDEIAHARYALLPDHLTFGILLPPKAEYVNLHPTTFHLHEVDGA
jgi:hypothetical protein